MKNENVKTLMIAMNGHWLDCLILALLASGFFLFCRYACGG